MTSHLQELGCGRLGAAAARFATAYLLGSTPVLEAGFLVSTLHPLPHRCCVRVLVRTMFPRLTPTTRTRPHITTTAARPSHKRERAHPAPPGRVHIPPPLPPSGESPVSGGNKLAERPDAPNARRPVAALHTAAAGPVRRDDPAAGHGGACARRRLLLLLLCLTVVCKGRHAHVDTLHHHRPSWRR